MTQKWTLEETKILKENWEKAPKEKLCEILPKRSWQGIRSKAIHLNLKRTAQPGWCEALDKVIKKGFEGSHDPKLTADDRKLLKFKLVTSVNRAAMTNNLQLKKWDDILKRANKLGFVWGIPEDVAKEQLALLKNLWDLDILLAYLIEKRTAKELEQHFGDTISNIEAKLPGRIDKYELISYRNAGGKTIFCYHERAVSNGTTQPRIWTPIQSNNTLLVKFPDTLDWRSIRILPLAEAYFDSDLFDEERFLEYLELAKRPYYFFIINGGIFALPPKGKSEEKIDILLHKSELLKQLLRPVAHKILWAIRGCTENTISNLLDFDPLSDTCRDLGIPYFGRPLMAEVLWGNHNYSFYCIHGTTTAKKRGSMINAAINLLNQFERINFVVMSHQKSGKENVVSRTVRDRVNCRLVSFDQHIIITPSFRRYEGSVEEWKGQEPPSQGSCAMSLFPDGRCGYSD